MKLTTDSPFANLDAAVKKLLDIANAKEADHAGRVDIGTINSGFPERGRQRCRVWRGG
jgi:hypothetical protein